MQIILGQQVDGRTTFRQQHKVTYTLGTAGILPALTALHTQTGLITSFNKMSYKMIGTNIGKEKKSGNLHYFFQFSLEKYSNYKNNLYISTE